MDRASLAARIQDILKSRAKPPGEGPRGAGAPPGGDDEEAAFAARCAAAEASARTLDVLGATLVERLGGPCVVVDREFPPDHVHGHHAVGRYARDAAASRVVLPSFLGEADPLRLPDVVGDGPLLLFFDLETTGLSGGAGTYAFLVGCGYFDGDAFRTRQFFLRGFGEERALLHAVEDELATVQAGRRPVLVTYNGRAFDVPLVETRYQFHRLRSPFSDLPHADMLFPARRLWRRRTPRAASPAGSAASGARGRGWGAAGTDEAPGSCALTAIERDILGLVRQDDVPGWEIPSRYFGYARTGDARGLEGVFEHNRLDLLSLAAVTAVILRLARDGADVVRERHECLALGRLLDYLGRFDDAERCFATAAAGDGTPETEGDRMLRADALHWLAVHRRRTRRFEDAAAAWRDLSEIAGVGAELRREALEALAIHHEHRAKDLEAARTFALRALDLADDARRVDEVRHRLGRLSRKLDGGGDTGRRAGRR
jgi:uncharacterized protein